METLVLVVHITVALGMIILILLQQGKGAEAGASFGGGASGTVFGAAGTGNFMTRTTAILTTIFFITSLGLAIIAKHQAANLMSLPSATSAPITPRPLTAPVEKSPEAPTPANPSSNTSTNPVN